MANMWSKPQKGSKGHEKVHSACSEHVSIDVCINGCAYLLCKVGCCGRRRAGVLACPGSWGRRYPPPGSVSGSESTARPCGKARHSPTPRCNTHTHTEKEKREREIVSMVPIMINYCWILHQTGELGRKKHDRANWKCQTQNRLQTFLFLVLLCLQIDQTKWKRN